MKKTIFPLLVICLALSAFTVLATVSWIPKEGYTIHFDTDKASGVINGLKGTINFDKNDIAHASFDVTVDVNTLNTGNWLKNRHAKADDFFDVDRYPTIRFVSSKIVPFNKAYKVTGNLTIKDVTKQVEIPFIFSGTGNTGKFDGYFAINKNDYHLVKQGVGDSVKIVLSIPVDKN